MIEFIGSAFPGTNAPMLVLMDVVLKATVVLALAYAAHAALGRGRALARSALWDAALIGLTLLPLAGLAFPRLRIAVLPAAAMAPALARSPGSGSFREHTSLADKSSAQAPPIALAPAGTLQPAVAAAADSGEPDPERRLRTAWLVPGAYLAVAALLALRLGVSLAAVRALKRRCEPVTHLAWLRALDCTRETLGIGRRVTIVKSDEVSIPMVVGWLRPTIVIPGTLAQSAVAELMDMVLIHELAHVKRGDFIWNLVYRFVRLVYWPHPLIWPVGRILSAVREQACDDVCVHGLGGAATYRASLLEVASGLMHRPELKVGLALARESNLARRLAWIDASDGRSRCLLSLPARFGTALAVVAVTVLLGAIEFERQAVASDQLKKGDTPKSEREMTPPTAIEIVVVAKDTGKPLPGATFRFSIDFESVIHKADNAGRIRFDLTRRKFQDSLSFDVWAEGYIQQRYFFSQNDARYPKIPARFAVDLLPGEETLGGRVVDEQGRPIRDVRVEIWGYLGQKKDKHELAYKVDATTDAQGNWRCRSFRSMTFAYLFLSHPDYLCDDDSQPRQHGKPRSGAPPNPDDPALAGLRDFSDMQVMTAGVSLAGKVTDEHDKPIAGAEVGWMLTRESHITFHGAMTVAATDAGGRFRFAHVRPGRVVIQVKANGHAPALETLDSIDVGWHIVVKLGPARSLTGRVVDSSGKPIADAFVNIDTWRGYRSLGVYLKSDATGRFRWDDAPPDTILINVSRAGFAGITQRSASTEQKELTLVLKRSLSISGRIIDAATNEPIEQADVEVGVAEPKTGEFTWGREQTAFSFQGRLQANIDVENRPELRLRISSMGYKPAVSRLLRGDENQVECDFKLTRAEKIPLPNP